MTKFRDDFDAAPTAQGAAYALQLGTIYAALQPTLAIGDIIYAADATNFARLAPNTTAAKQYLSMTGTGTAGAAPAWDTLTTADITDYVEGTWTPVLTFATPGDVSVSYTAQDGVHTKIGRCVHWFANVITSAFTHTTAAGNVQITGLPFTSANVTQRRYVGTAGVQGITKATYTQFVPVVNDNSSTILIAAGGSGVAFANVTAADMPTGGTVAFRLAGTYHV